MKPLRLITIASMGIVLLACRKAAPPLEKSFQSARPELRQAIAAMRTPTELMDNYGEEVQVAWRLQILLEEQHFRPQPADADFLRLLLTNTNESAYSRICAAFFLLDSEPAARALLTNYVASNNLRHRFNAARAIQWYAWGARGEARDWAGLQLVKMLEDRSLELPFGTRQISAGYEPNGFDMMDDCLPPLAEVVYTIGEMKERRAIPVLKSMTGSDSSGGAALALGRIGDPSAGPFLLNFYDVSRTDAMVFADALAQLKFRPAVPIMTNHLRQNIDTYVGFRLLTDLVEIGDRSALPAMKSYVLSLNEGKWRRSGSAILAQLQQPDPVFALLEMQAMESEQDVQVELLQGLGRFADQRAIDRLFAVSLTSPSTLLRGNAIWSLGKMGDQRAMLALVSLMETNAPPPTNFDKPAILEGRPADYTKRKAERALREASHRNIGMSSASWRELIVQSTNSPAQR